MTIELGYLHKDHPWIAYINKIIDPTELLFFMVLPGENGEPSYEHFHWLSEDSPKPTEEEFYAAAEKAKALTYKTSRRELYPPLEEQLDMMFHNPELWRSTIQEIKDKYPKPI